MAYSLKRLLQLRSLQEELAGRELTSEAARLRGIERRVAEAEAEARVSRERWFLAVNADMPEIAPGSKSKSDAIATELSIWELASWRSDRAKLLRLAQEGEVDRAREEFLAVRRERMKVESLVQAAISEERLEAARREQRQLDDWHQGRPGSDRGRNRDTQRTSKARSGRLSAE